MANKKLGLGLSDVVVTEGFAGNIALKAAEGTARQLSHILKEELAKTWATKLGYLFARRAFRALSSRMDPRKFNGTVFVEWLKVSDLQPKDAIFIFSVGGGNLEKNISPNLVRALQSADVILIDDLVAPGILDFARREAKKMLVGKTGYGPSCKQDDINALLIERGVADRRRCEDRAHEPLHAALEARLAKDLVSQRAVRAQRPAHLSRCLVRRSS